MSSVDQLPTEIIILIFSFLDPIFCITKLRLVSKQLNEAFEEESSLKFLWKSLWRNIFFYEHQAIKERNLETWRDYFDSFQQIIKNKYTCKFCHLGSIDERRKRNLLKLCMCNEYLHWNCYENSSSLKFTSCSRCKAKYQVEWKSENDMPYTSPSFEYYSEITMGFSFIIVLSLICVYVTYLIHTSTDEILIKVRHVIVAIWLIIQLFMSSNGPSRESDGFIVLYIFELGLSSMCLFMMYEAANNHYFWKMKKYYKIKDVQI